MARRRTKPCSSSPPTSTTINPPRSLAWSACSPPSRTERESAMQLSKLSLAISLIAAAACAGTGATAGMYGSSAAAPSPDPRIGLRAGLMDAQEAVWNLHVMSKTPPSEKFMGITNSDLAFTGPYAIQGSYNGYQVWEDRQSTRLNYSH